MSDEALSADHETRAAERPEDPAPTPEANLDALESLRDIVFGKRLEQLEVLRDRVGRLKATLAELHASADQRDAAAARELAERIAATDALGARLDELQARATRIESEARTALAEGADAAEALARRVDAAEALAERVEGEGGLAERIEHVERLTDRVDDIERLAQRVQDIDRLDERLATVEPVRERVVDEDLRAEDVGAVLPRAVAARARKDGQLAASLRPTIEDTLEASVRRNPQALVDIIFPVLGPAIRKMIGSAITSMVGSINRAVESSFTIRGLKWRMQAWRTKRSYAEIALMHGLVYRVEELFLIQRGSGLLLAHASRGPESEEPEVISGMLTAITDFVRDSFDVEQGSEVETFRVGDLTLVVKGGSKAVLAATVRGVPPPALHDRLQTSIEEVHRDYGRQIDAFDGDMESLAGVEALLEPNLLEEAKGRKKRGPASLVFWVLLAVVAATAVTSLVTNRMRAARVERDVRQLARTLQAEPGIVVTDVHEGDERWIVEGLRDPLAADPEELRAKSAVDGEDVELRMGAYRSLEPVFVQRRLLDRLSVPDTVRATWRDRTLVLTGPVYSAWIRTALQAVADVPEVDGVDISGLTPDPALDALLVSRAVLIAQRVPVDTPVTDELIASVREQVEGARTTAGERFAVELQVITLLPRAEDEPKARAQAATVVRLLERAGIQSTEVFRGPADLARPKPDDLMPAGDSPEIRFDLTVRLAEGGR